MLNTKTLIQFQNIELSFNDKQILNNVSGAILQGNIIGLIGINGSGKSSLLKLISGIKQPDAGKVMVYAKTEYVEQIDLEKYKKEITVFEYIESKNESWWDIVTMVEKIFDSNIVVTQPLNTLSGGEIIKLNICIALSQNPELILLDEPTNHLDLNSIEKLNKYIKNSNLTFVIVSHNIDFLDKTVNIIWEIDNKKLNVYGGNYSFFKSEKDKKIQAQLNRYEAMKKKVTRETKSLNTLQTKYQKGKSKLEKMAKTHDRSIPKKKRKTMMDGLQTGYGDIKSQKKKTLQTHIVQLNEMKINHRRNIHVKLNYVSKKGLILKIENGNLRIQPNRTILKNIIISIYHSDRIAILGNNGTGKSLLVKQFVYNKKEKLVSQITYGKQYKTVYVDQLYEIIDPELSLVDNIVKYNNNLCYEDIRKLLGNFTFTDEIEINKKASYLSGGEIARLAFAIATSSLADLLILDEPTNNLDIDTKNIIAKAVKEYDGSLVIISHDIDFINKIGIKKYYQIENKTLHPIDLIS